MLLSPVCDAAILASGGGGGGIGSLCWPDAEDEDESAPLACSDTSMFCNSLDSRANSDDIPLSADELLSLVVVEDEKEVLADELDVVSVELAAVVLATDHRDPYPLELDMPDRLVMQYSFDRVAADRRPRAICFARPVPDIAPCKPHIYHRTGQ
jgi:hypothetical protein